MKEWIIPGLYVLVYLDKRAVDFDLVYHLDLQRPFVICPGLKGKTWDSLRRKINEINTAGLYELINFSIKEFSTEIGSVALSVSSLVPRNRSDFTSLVEVMAANAFLNPENEETKEAFEIAKELLEKIGFSKNDFHAEILKVDFGTAGLHQYCLFGGFNTYVCNVLKKDQNQLESLENLTESMNDRWHEKLASYLSVILWSKIKVSPLLRAALIDDSLTFQSIKIKKEIESSFQTMVKRVLMAYARNPL
jgi:predicted house-cleaning noncanonical NTP pyrophosphatase (MazG superfamily)